MTIFARYRTGQVVKIRDSGKTVVVETIYATVTSRDRSVEYTVRHVDGDGKEDVEERQLMPLDKRGD